MNCIIFCGGIIEDYDSIIKYVQDAQLILSVDSGARHCRKLGIVPDYLIGDFDSISEEDYKAMTGAGVPVMRFPSEKDMTDSELAIQVACEKGSRQITLLGAIGSRIDHMLSNLFLLKKLADLNIEGVVANEKNEIRIIKDHIELNREKDMFISLLPVAGNAVGVTTRGLYYPLENATLEVGSSWGISNLVINDCASVSVKEGYLLVIKSRD
jgi:thiamine pyrophosphokinase